MAHAGAARVYVLLAPVCRTGGIAARRQGMCRGVRMRRCRLFVKVLGTGGSLEPQDSFGMPS